MKNVILVLGFISLLAIAACKRDDVLYLGPAICPEENFQVLKSAVIANQVDFKVAPKKVTIKDSLSQVTPWTVTIEGLTSKAKKVYTGKSSVINIDWYGEPGSSTFFQAEDCNITLEVPCIGVMYTKHVKITATTDFSAISYLMWNFDDETTISSYPSRNNWNIYNTPTLPAHIAPSPQGGTYFSFQATSDDPTWYYGSLNGSASGTTTKPQIDTLVAKTSTDPSKVYFNFYANTNGKSLSQIYILMTEKVGAKTFRRYIAYNGNFSGWKYFSFKLSDILIQDVSAIKDISIAFQSAPTQGTQCEVNIDMPIFTLNKPLLDQ